MPILDRKGHRVHGDEVFVAALTGDPPVPIAEQGFRSAGRKQVGLIRW
jgi:hypothetical protein